MRIKDVALRLIDALPEHTGLFCDTLDIDSINASGGIATVVTSSNHGLSNNSAINISNVAVKTPISSFTKDGLLYTFTTSLEHDLTFGWSDHKTIELGGFTDSAWNNVFDLRSSDNRFEFVVNSPDTQPILNGNEYLLEYNRVDGIGGAYSVNIINDTTFTIEGDFIDGDYTPVNGVVYSNPRIGATVDIDRVIDQYTKYGANQYWLYAEPVNVDVSKDRTTLSDANHSIGNGADMRIRMVDGFTLYIIAPCSDEIAGEVSLDVCRHDLLLPLMKTLYGYQFDTGTSNPMDFRTTLKSHGVVAYDRAYLVYSYEFEVVIDLTNDDAVSDQDTRSFRNVDYTHHIGGGDTTDMTITNIFTDIDRS